MSETKIQHVNLMVSDLDAAVGFYTGVLGLGLANTPDLGFPAQFITINEYQQIHLNQLPDTTPERAHFCLRVADFNGVFARAKAAGVIETGTWGPAKRLPSGVLQMFVRDPEGNLVEIACDADQAVDPRILADEVFATRDPVIVLLETVHADALAMLEAVDAVRVMADPSTITADVPRAEVRVMLTRGRGRITAATLDEFPALVVVGRCGAGLDNIDVGAAASRGVAVVNAPGATTAAVAEHATMLMLALGRRVVTLDAAVKDGRWAVRDGYVGTELRGKRLGVVGLGDIGRRVAAIAGALGMHVSGWNRTPRDVAGVAARPLDELLAECDVVQVCVALTPDTRHLLDERRLALLAPGAMVINTARGAVVDHAALVEALVSGRLGGYAADVWDPEPPTDAIPAAIADRLLLTPHVAAITDTTYRELCVRTVESALDVLQHRA